MGGEGEVIEAHSGLPLERVAEGVLSANYRRIKKGRCIDCIAHKTQDVDGREIDCQPDKRTPTAVFDRLRIEGGRPAERTSINSQRRPVEEDTSM